MAEVFVVDRAGFFSGAWPQGFVPVASDEAWQFLSDARRKGRYVDRAEAEETPAWKQWIPYCVVRCVGPDGQPTGVLQVRRTSGATEARLHGHWSIGLGGHVEPADGAPDAAAEDRRESFFCNALRRELEEELHLPAAASEVTPRFVGLLNDDSTAVGSVHAGLVYVLDLTMALEEAQKSLSIREISKMAGGFGSLVELANLWQDPKQFESWSQFLIRAGVAGPMATSPDARTTSIQTER